MAGIATPKGSSPKKAKAAKKKKPKSPTDIADELFGKIIRGPGVCVSCGSTYVIQCSHGFSRRYRAVRWDERNAFPQCRACHMSYTQNPLKWDEWLRAQWGLPLYEEIRHLALNGSNPNPKEVAARLRERLDQIERRAA